MSNAKQTSKKNTIILGDIERLNHLLKDELQQVYKQYFPRRTIPQVKQLMVAEIAYHIQSQQLGSIDKVTQDRLHVCKQQFLIHSVISSKVSAQSSTEIKRPVKTRPRVSNQLNDGTVLKRQFNGRVYEVLVRIENGKTIFLFQNNSYRSLSKIAEEITGSHWSGPRFFGLVKLKSSTQSKRDAKAS